MKIRTLEVVLKLAERCNIDCTYCYVFNGNDQSYKKHPPILREEQCVAVANFLASACRENEIEKLQIDFHGGEPMLLGKRRFSAYCEIFEKYLTPVTELSLAIQTNATMVDDEWVDIFSKYQVSPGISLDGTKELNDKNRVDFKGRGTYEKTIHGFNLLKNAFDQGDINSLGVLCVIDPENSATEIYNHFVHTLGVKTMDFLLPDLTYDTIGSRDRAAEGVFLCELFDRWVEDDNPDVFIRSLNSVVSLLMGGRSKVIGFGQEMPLAIGIATDGTIAPDDTLRSCGEKFYTSEFNVSSHTLSDFFNSPQMLGVLNAGKSTPEECTSCCWESLCGGGHLVHRYSEEQAFKQKSVLCTGLKVLYAHIGAYLVNRGMPVKLMQRNLKLAA